MRNRDRAGGKSAEPEQGRADSRHGSVFGRLRNYFFAGILFTAPVGITIWLTWEVISFIDDRFTPLIPARWNPETYLPFTVPGLGLLLAIIFLILIGMFAAGYTGRLFMGLGERMVNRVPVIRSIYGATKQIFEAVFAQQAQAFRQVVLIEYPRRGSWAVGFLTGTTSGEVQRNTREVVKNVFVPATPNPTTGFLLFVPEREIHVLDMTVEDGIKLVISGGIVTPPEEGAPPPLAADRPPAAAENEAPRKGRFAIVAKLRNYLLAGVLVAAPISITLWLAWNLIAFVDNRVTPLIPEQWNPETYLPFGVPGLGMVVFVIVMIIVGSIAAGLLGRAVMRTMERSVARVPVVRSIYATVKQIFETVLSKRSSFREVALFQYPRSGVWSLGFVTGRTQQDIQERTLRSTVNVFLPTTPNPTSGFLLFLPEHEVRILEMTVEQGLKMIVSGGIVTPEEEERSSADEESRSAAPSPRDAEARSPAAE
jgi:uncharacterized membrane protein